MTTKLVEWPSKRGPITKIMPRDGCKGNKTSLAVGKWYDFHEFGCHLGNVGSNAVPGDGPLRSPRAATGAPSGDCPSSNDLRRMAI